MRFKYWCFWAVLILVPLAMTEVDAQDPDPTLTKAVPVKSPDFLKIPEGLDAKKFTVAKTAPGVEFTLFGDLKPGKSGTLWSSWGDGVLAKNGNYYTTVGDHLGVDANSYIYEYNPKTRVLRRVVDVLKAIMHQLGLYGHGKIHATLYQAADGKIYFTTYWGVPNETPKFYEAGTYQGSIMMSFDPETGKVENFGAPVPKFGLPANAFDPKRQLMYFHAVYKGDVAVYDIAAKKVKFLGGNEITDGNRTFMVDAEGKVYFSGKDECLHYYDPDKNAIASTKFQLPINERLANALKNPPKGKKVDPNATGRGVLRASIMQPTKDGTLYGMSYPGQMFAFNPQKKVMKDLGVNWLEGDYTAVMVISPDEKYLYYAPGAHGSGSRSGVPVIQYDIKTGQRKVLAFLKEALKKTHDYEVGGTYNLQIDGAGENLYITFNGGAPGISSPFGKPSVVVLNIPASERP